MIKKIKSGILQFFKVIVGVLGAITIFIVLRWLGLKGLLGLLLGITATAYLMLTNNLLLAGLIKLLTDKEFQEELFFPKKEGDYVDIKNLRK